MSNMLTYLAEDQLNMGSLRLKWTQELQLSVAPVFRARDMSVVWLWYYDQVLRLHRENRVAECKRWLE